MKLNIMLDDNAKMPTYAHSTDACMDIFSNEEVTIKAGCFKVVKTGVHIDIPVGYEVQIRSRSGLAAKHGIHVLNAPGIIDAGYIGEFGVILQNVSDEDYCVAMHERIAQICIKEVIKMEFELVDSLKDTNRGSNGYGSTGKK